MHPPPRYVLASILSSFGGCLFGMDTGIIGSVTTMKSYQSSFGAQSATIHGLIVSSILIPAAFSSFFAGRIADALGRPQSISIGAMVFGVGTAIEAGAVEGALGMFAAGRIVEGVGEGVFLGTLVVYICEISPPSKRGPLTASVQLLITIGLVVGFFLCYGCATIDSSLGWRAPFIVLSALSMSFALATRLWLVPSPRWLVLRGRCAAEVSAAWDVLGVGQAEREKAEMELRSASSAGETQTPTEKDGLLRSFERDVRSRTWLGMFLLAMQQMSGIDGVLYYAPLLFTQAGLASSEASFLASGVSAIVIFTVTIPALILSDRWGRRHSTIYGGIGISLTMFLIGGLYAGEKVYANHGVGRWIVIVSIYVYAAIFSVSWAVGIKIYVAESQPQRTRASATNLAHGSNWLTNFLVALTTPILLAKSSYAAYFLFGGCTLITAAVCFLEMPETKGKSLDEIEEAFRKRTKGKGRIARAMGRVMGRRAVVLSA